MPALIVTAIDITEQKRAEEALRESERFLDNVFEGIQEGISILDVDMNIVKANHAMERWYSHMLPLVGKKCYQAYHGHTSACADCPSLRAMKEKTMQMSVVPYINESGFAGWMELYSSPLEDDQGNVIGVIEHVRDVTERKKAEKELVNAKAQAELYLDLMGHDINNMHQVALGYLELVRDMPAGEERDMFLDKPVEVLQRSAKLISNVRKLQKLHDGMFHDQDVDVCKVLSNVQREFEAVPDKKITLSLNGFERCHVRANELLHDVFSNLVGNAVKHTGDRADIVIDLDVVNDNGGRYCRVAVEDDGPGIPDDFKAKIFNRALKGTDKAKGMGLGLYLVKSLVDSYGGRVWVEDRVPGDHTRGARFVVMLPTVEN